MSNFDYPNRRKITYDIQRVKRRNLDTKHLDFLNGDTQHIYYYSDDANATTPARFWGYKYLTQDEFNNATLIGDGKLITKIVDDYQSGFIERQLLIENDDPYGAVYGEPHPMAYFKNQFSLEPDDKMQIELERLMQGQPEFTFYTQS